MGAEATCTCTYRKSRTEGKALLESDALTFRGGDVRLSVPFKAVKAVEARDGTLRVTLPRGVAEFALGAAAARWAERIRNPPSRLDKLGVKPAHHVVVLGVADETFLRELTLRAARVSTRLARGVDIIFVGFEQRTELGRLTRLRGHLKPAGAVWVIRPRGVDTLTERDVMDAGKAAGLVDVKVARFSDTHTAEKFVIPVARR